MLAHVMQPKHNVAGWFMSEKLDGMRAFWDGGGSRGKPLGEIPWANVAKQGLDKVSTGLWSRYGHPIFAPDWWLDKLPNFTLDGEIYIGRKMFQQTMSIARTFPENRIEHNWHRIKYMIFDAPPISQVFRNGHIKSDLYEKIITADMGLMFKDTTRLISPRGFVGQLKFLEMFLEQSDLIKIHEQKKLSFKESEARLQVADYLLRVTTEEGEGVILRDPDSYWEPIRSHKMLKVKNLDDAEGVVVGYSAGEIGKTGKLHGLIGAVMIEAFGVKFNISGFNDKEREFADTESTEWAIANPGATAPNWVNSKYFPRGTVVTFEYRELSDEGIPKEARYQRKHIV